MNGKLAYNSFNSVDFNIICFYYTLISYTGVPASSSPGLYLTSYSSEISQNRINIKKILTAIAEKRVLQINPLEVL